MLLEYLTPYESAQAIAIIGLGAVALALVIMGKLNARQANEEVFQTRKREWDESVADKEIARKEVVLRLQDEMAQHEHQRKSEWHLLTTKPTLIDRRKKDA